MAETKEKTEGYKVVEVTTQTSPAIQGPDGVLDIYQALAEILNTVKKIKNAVA